MGKIHSVSVFDITPEDVEVRQHFSEELRAGQVIVLDIAGITFHFDQAEDMLAMLDTAKQNLLDMTSPIEA